MDTKLGYIRLPLEVHGAEIAQRRVPARRVVEALDIIEHVYVLRLTDTWRVSLTIADGEMAAWTAKGVQL